MKVEHELNQDENNAIVWNTENSVQITVLSPTFSFRIMVDNQLEVLQQMYVNESTGECTWYPVKKVDKDGNPL